MAPQRVFQPTPCNEADQHLQSLETARSWVPVLSCPADFAPELVTDLTQAHASMIMQLISIYCLVLRFHLYANTSSRMELNAHITF